MSAISVEFSSREISYIVYTSVPFWRARRFKAIGPISLILSVSRVYCSLGCIRCFRTVRAVAGKALCNI